MPINGPLAVSAPGTSLTTATGKNVTFNTRYPFAKIDSQNPVSFQFINILFSHDTPNPNGTSVKTNSTLVYQFFHGYSYVPKTWFLASLNSFTSVIGSEGVYLVGGGGVPMNGSAYLSIRVDTNNVYFYINKQWDSSLGHSAPTVFALVLTVRAYVFVNDLSGTDVPSQA